MLTRRALLAGAAVGVVAPRQALAADPFPLDSYSDTYENWAKELRVGGLMACAPSSAREIVAVANWAARNGYRVRPSGHRHGWSPLLVDPRAPGRTVLVDTTRHLTAVGVSGRRVRAQAGASMDALLVKTERNGLGFTSVPAPGDITIGGALAIDAHGTAISDGTLSRRVGALEALVWNRRRGRFVLRRFERDDPDLPALMTHVGRSFVTSVELRADADVHLRCQSFTDIPATELFGSSGRTFASFVEETGRVEAIWFPFTEKPWLKTWAPTPVQPAGSRAVDAPYNYPFSDNIPEEVSDLARQIVEGRGEATPTYGQLQYEVSAAALAATGADDLWGLSKNLLLYVRPTTIRETANGYAVCCRRADIQRVVREFAEFFTRHVGSYRDRGSYPVNMPVEIRVTGLDRRPVLSAARVVPRHPELDVAVWLDVLTFPGTPEAQVYYRELERFIFSNYSRYAVVRPEWSKGWGYDGMSAWADRAVLRRVMPRRPLDTFARLDPRRVFTSGFHDRLMP